MDVYVNEYHIMYKNKQTNKQTRYIENNALESARIFAASDRSPQKSEFDRQSNAVKRFSTPRQTNQDEKETEKPNNQTDTNSRDAPKPPYADNTKSKTHKHENEMNTS